MDALKQRALNALESNREKIIALGETLFLTPETGYNEINTSAVMLERLAALGVLDITRCAVTGIKGYLRGGAHHVCVGVMGELDAVISPQHPAADPVSHAAHACGHNAQLAVLYGVALALQESGVMADLQGDVCLLAVPAEEYIQIEERKQLIAEGKIKHLGGKQQLLAEGALDDVDMIMMTHSETDAPQKRVAVHGEASGFIGKTVRFIGKEAHAGGAPHLGINALNAASLAISAIHYQREIFRDDDHVRVHPILTKGGDLVNTVPADVRMESYVRAATAPALKDANAKVDRAIRGACYALGAQCEIENLSGYLPMRQDRALGEVFASNARQLLGDAAVTTQPFAGSTDMGDLCHVMPGIQPTISGFRGAAHSKEFCVDDPEMAYIVPAQILLMTVVDLLKDNAAQAIAIRDAFPRKNYAEYQETWRALLEEKESC